jgi:hypothetical protein
VQPITWDTLFQYFIPQQVSKPKEKEKKQIKKPKKPKAPTIEIYRPGQETELMPLTKE